MGELSVNFFEWMPTCLRVQLKLGTLALAIDNQQIGRNITLASPDVVIIKSIWTNAAKIAEVNVYSHQVWDQILTDGFPKSSGNILAWNTSLWQPDMLPLSAVPKRMVIGQRNTSTTGRYLMVPVRMDFNSAVESCRHLGNGTLAQFKNMDELQDVWLEASRVMAIEDDYLWSAYIMDSENSAKFLDVQTKQPINADLWQEGKPNNLAQRCVIFDQSGYDDEYCNNNPLKFACHLEQRHRHRLRGLCSDSALDTVYFPYTLYEELIWVGTGHSETGNTFIRYNRSSFSWEARKTGADAWASAEADYSSLLIGTGI